MLIPVLLVLSYLLFVSVIAGPGLVTSPAAQRVSHVFGLTQSSTRLSYPYPMPRVRLRALALSAGLIISLPLVVLFIVVGIPPAIGLLVAPVGYLGVISKYTLGWPRRMVRDMENELPSLAAFVFQLSGIGTLPISTTLMVYSERFPARPLASLIGKTPQGVDPVDFLQERSIPSVPVNGALSVLGKMQQNPNRRRALRRLYESQERRVRLELEKVIESRVAKSPIATVMLLLPALLVTALVPVALRFMKLMGAL